MKITSIDQALMQLYAKIEKNLDIDLELPEKVQALSKRYDNNILHNLDALHIDQSSISNDLIMDRDISAAIVSLALGIKPTDKNHLFIKRLGYSVGSGIQRLLTPAPEDDNSQITNNILDIAMPLEEIADFITQFNGEDLIELAKQIDLLLAYTRKASGEYLDIPTRLLLEPHNQAQMQQEIDSAIMFLKENNFEINQENIEFVDKLLFIFREPNQEVPQVLEFLAHHESTINLESVLNDPETFLNFYIDIHSFDDLIDRADTEEVYNLFDSLIDKIERFIKTFPEHRRGEVLSLFEDSLLNLSENEPFIHEIILEDLEKLNNNVRDDLAKLFKSRLHSIKESNTRSNLYTLIESDLGEILQYQVADEFPFWLVPIISQYEDLPVFGELWIKKRSKDNPSKKSPYALSLWADFENFGRMEFFIYGIDRNIDIYIICRSEVQNVIVNNKENILNVFKEYEFSVKKFKVSNPKAKQTIFTYILAKSAEIQKNIDVSI
ncbi:MAG: hypothetical protein GX974_00715 [Clostridiales bacterium]|nr:hypothetical protein [Clostridiales bacterium]